MRWRDFAVASFKITRPSHRFGRANQKARVLWSAMIVGISLQTRTTTDLLQGVGYRWVRGHNMRSSQMALNRVRSACSLGEDPEPLGSARRAAGLAIDQNSLQDGAEDRRLRTWGQMRHARKAKTKRLKNREIDQKSTRWVTHPLNRLLYMQV